MFTIIGGKGFIGSHLVSYLQAREEHCFVPERGDKSIFTKPLGKIIYCAGLTSDYRQRPFDTVEAHVSFISNILQKAQFTSLTYLSSTRVYMGEDSTKETNKLKVLSNSLNYFYNLTKLCGESICLNSGRNNCRIARLSNVIGNDFSSGNFIYALINEAVHHGCITLNQTLRSEKDYIYVDDAVNRIISITNSGKHQIYNIASGKNISHQRLVDELQLLTGCNLQVLQDAIDFSFPVIDTSRIDDEFNLDRKDIISLLPKLVQKYLNTTGDKYD